MTYNGNIWLIKQEHQHCFVLNRILCNVILKEIDSEGRLGT